ncbi:MAG: DNA-3-methyladenine glycosylase [Micrococcales bacterium]|nr:DNA-3-methyladenine glycosylase [Micrococcales bacterium]
MTQLARMPASFFDRPVLEVAPDLLGCVIEHAGVSIRLTEVEAYDGERDPGSHAYRGLTPRTEVMFGPPGGLYVYFTYGMHFCANLVCGPEGTASAVLMRAGEVLDGTVVARERRSARRRPEAAPVLDRDLARGPARLAVALAFGREQNGLLPVQAGCPVVVRPGCGTQRPSGTAFLVGPRVGVAGPGGDGTRFPWRFWLPGEPSVSAYRPGSRRTRAKGLDDASGE